MFLAVSGCGSTVANQTAATAPVDASAFVGQWFQHAGALNIKPNGEIDLAYQVEQAPASASFPELKLQLESITGDTATAVVTSTNDSQVAAGSKFTFRKAEPGMVVTTPDGGTALWCDTAHKDQGACGA
jgi:hypothetical protein